MENNISCELLSNLYLWNTDNTFLWINLLLGYVVNCSQICIFEILTTPQREDYTPHSRCELLSNLYLWNTDNTPPWWLLLSRAVVNCSQICIFEILTTPDGFHLTIKMTLWIALKFVSLKYWQHPVVFFDYDAFVVNCSQICIFEILTTPHPRRGRSGRGLWIALKFVSLKYWQHPFTRRKDKRRRCELLSNLYLWNTDNTRTRYIGEAGPLWIALKFVSLKYWQHPSVSSTVALHSCELLSNLYLWNTDNTPRRAILKAVAVVNCSQICIFEILTTPYQTNVLIPKSLWIALKFVSLKYWQHHGRLNGKDLVSCELLSNLYLWNTDNTDYTADNTGGFVVNCSQICIFEILTTPQVVYFIEF